MGRAQCIYKIKEEPSSLTVTAAINIHYFILPIHKNAEILYVLTTTACVDNLGMFLQKKVSDGVVIELRGFIDKSF